MIKDQDDDLTKAFCCYLDGPVHYSYHTYGPEYYPPGPIYPIYPEEDYFPPQMHVKTNLVFSKTFFNSFSHSFEGSTTSFNDFTWW